MYTTMSSIDSDSQRLCTKFMVSSDEDEFGPQTNE